MTGALLEEGLRAPRHLRNAPASASWPATTRAWSAPRATCLAASFLEVWRTRTPNGGVWIDVSHLARVVERNFRGMSALRDFGRDLARAGRGRAHAHFMMGAS